MRIMTSSTGVPIFIVDTFRKNPKPDGAKTHTNPVGRRCRRRECRSLRSSLELDGGWNKNPKAEDVGTVLRDAGGDGT